MDALNEVGLISIATKFCMECGKEHCISKYNSDECDKLRFKLQEEIAAKEAAHRICVECERKYDCRHYIYNDGICDLKKDEHERLTKICSGEDENVIHIDRIPDDQKARLLEEKPVNMVAMQKRIQAMLLRARQEIVDTQTLTASAMVSVVDALFYLVEMSGPVPEAIPAPYVMRTGSTEDIGVCKSTGNYCTGCNPGPCEHRK